MLLIFSKQKFTKMKSSIKFLLFFIATFFVVGITAQSEDSEKDESFRYHQAQSHTFHAGLGMPNPTNIAVSFLNLLDQEAKASPQFTLMYEYGLTDQIGVGAYGGYYQATADVNIPTGISVDCCLTDPLGSCCLGAFQNDEKNASYKMRAFTLGGRFSYHYIRLKKIDTFSSIRLGYSFIGYKETGDQIEQFQKIKAPTFEYFINTGARIYITPNWGVYGVVGHSVLSPFHANIGCTYRL